MSKVTKKIRKSSNRMEEMRASRNHISDGHKEDILMRNTSQVEDLTNRRIAEFHTSRINKLMTDGETTLTSLLAEMEMKISIIKKERDM